MSLNTSPYPRVPCSACPTEIYVQQRTTTNTEPGWQPTGTIISSFHCTSPVRWLGNCVLWQGEVCYGMVAKQIKEREIKSCLKWNTAQASVLLGSGWDPQGSLQTGIQFLSFSARSVNAPNSTLWQKLLGNAATGSLRSAKKQGRGNSAILSPAPLHPQAKGKRPEQKTEVKQKSFLFFTFS